MLFGRRYKSSLSNQVFLSCVVTLEIETLTYSFPFETNNVYRFFELDPTPAVFSFGRDVSELNDRFYASPGLHQHAKNVIRYLDRAIDLLASGDSDNELGGVLLDLGQKHASFGVTARMYQPMGQALIATVAEILGEDRFTPDVLQAWIEVFEALASEMIRAKDS